MTDAVSVALLEYLRKVGLGLEPDFLREAIRVLSEALMEVEVSQKAGAERYERKDTRTTYRNGYRERTWATRVGEIALRIPKLREGSYFPSLLEPRRRAERALLAVVQQAYIQGVSSQGVSTRKVDELVQALGLSAGVDKSAVSRICREQDGRGGAVPPTPTGGCLSLSVARCALPHGAPSTLRTTASSVKRW